MNERLRSYRVEYPAVREVCGWLLFIVAVYIWMSSQIIVVHAAGDNFTDVLKTNSFRGSFEWFAKLDWIGMIVQAVVSIFSLLGVCLIVVRIMTSMLYLSAKGLWEEVHDLKNTGGGDKMDFGLLAMGKSWVTGKAGTGLDAIVGAVLILLPDVKKYSDFGEKSGNQFDQDVTMTQYILKIALPTILSVFFLAMGFNGTLITGVATTVDAMGTLADKAVTINFAGFCEDLVNQGTGYKFTYRIDDSEQGQFKLSLANNLYGRVISAIDGEDAVVLDTVGRKIEETIDSQLHTWIEDSPSITQGVKDALGNTKDGALDEEGNDRYWETITFNVIANSRQEGVAGKAVIPLTTFTEGLGLGETVGAVPVFFHISFSQVATATGTMFNVNN